MYSREPALSRRALVLSLLIVGATLVPAGAAAASPLDLIGPALEANDEEHCVAEVIDQSDDGELILAEPRCYNLFSLAISDASDGELSLPLLTSGKAAYTDELLQAQLASNTRGTHYTGSNGGGSSITIPGSCNDGWWNTSSTWANKISSSRNGCARLRHFDYPNRSGAQASTTGRGALRNLPSSMNNRTESVSYHAS